MARWTGVNDEWSDESDVGEESDELDSSDDDDDLCFPCPYCGQRILEESERCPHCEHYLSKEDTPVFRKPIWFVVGLVACFYAVYRWIRL